MYCCAQSNNKTENDHMTSKCKRGLHIERHLIVTGATVRWNRHSMSIKRDTTMVVFRM